MTCKPQQGQNAGAQRSCPTPCCTPLSEQVLFVNGLPAANCWFIMNTYKANLGNRTHSRGHPYKYEPSIQCKGSIELKRKLRVFETAKTNKTSSSPRNSLQAQNVPCSTRPSPPCLSTHPPPASRLATRQPATWRPSRAGLALAWRRGRGGAPRAAFPPLCRRPPSRWQPRSTAGPGRAPGVRRAQPSRIHPLPLDERRAGHVRRILVRRCLWKWQRGLAVLHRVDSSRHSSGTNHLVFGRFIFRNSSKQNSFH